MNCRDIQISAQDFAKPPKFLALSRARWLDMGTRRVRLDPLNFPSTICTVVSDPATIALGSVVANGSDTSFPHTALSSGVAGGSITENIADFSLQQRLDNLRRIHGNNIIPNGLQGNNGPQIIENAIKSSFKVKVFRTGANTLFEASNFPFLGASTNTSSSTDTVTSAHYAAGIPLMLDIGEPEELQTHFHPN